MEFIADSYISNNIIKESEITKEIIKDKAGFFSKIILEESEIARDINLNNPIDLEFIEGF